MNFSKAIILSLLFLGFAGTSNAQSTFDIKVKKASPITREFFYHDKPISPLALIKMFPITDTIDTIDLKQFPFQKETRRDDFGKFDWYTDSQRHSTYIKFDWLTDNQRQRTYSLYHRFDSENDIAIDSTEFVGASYCKIAYSLIGNTIGGKFIVLASDQCTDAKLLLGYVFILDIVGDKLIRLGGFWESNDYSLNNYPVIIKGNTITNGANKYEIPASAG